MLENLCQALATVMALLFLPYAMTARGFGGPACRRDRLPGTHRHGAQNTQIRVASVLIETQQAFAPSEPYLRVRVELVATLRDAIRGGSRAHEQPAAATIAAQA